MLYSCPVLGREDIDYLLSEVLYFVDCNFGCQLENRCLALKGSMVTCDFLKV